MSKRNNSAVARLKQDYSRLKKDPIPYILAEPNPSNILEWHYVLRGPENTEFHDGLYHGKLVFPTEFPYKPPSIVMFTPNGRFKTNTRLCMSNSDFHPDTWNPAWSVSTLLTGFLSFMLEKSPTLGSIEATSYERQILAKQSHAFNLKNKAFSELFPNLVDEITSKLEQSECGESCRRGDEVESIDPQASFREQLNHNGGQSAMANCVVILGFTIFAVVVKYVLQTLSTE